MDRRISCCLTVSCELAMSADCEFCSQFHSDSKPESLTKGRSIGLSVAGLFGASSLAIIAICVPFLRPGFRKICLPYVPATDTQIQNVLTALKGSSGTLIDCGSGDGRIVFAAAKAGFKATGVELNSCLVLYSKFRATTMGLSKQAKFEHKDIFNVDFSQYENVVVFGVDSLMPELEKIFRSKELRVVACRFPLPNTRPVVTVGEGVDRVWLYHFPSSKSDQ